MEENTIVSEVVFGESSSGAAIVQGSFVGQGASESCSMYVDGTNAHDVSQLALA